MSIQTQAEAFLAEKRIAVVGASQKQGTGKFVFKGLQDRGYEVVPVNPNAEEVEGATCYTSVKAIPGEVNAAVIVTRPEIAEQVVRECVEAGVSRVWMHHNAFAGAKNSSVSEAGAEYGREHGIDVIAGGCPLMFGEGADFGHKCMRWLLKVMKKLRISLLK